MVKLLNATVMPAEGTYVVWRVSAGEFADTLKLNEFTSYIGYAETAKFIEDLAGVPVPVCRDQAEFKDGDVFLVCKLKRRVANPADKGSLRPTEDDYEFWRGEYHEDLTHVPTR